MLRTLITITLALILPMLSTSAGAQDVNLRLLLHGTHTEINDSSVGIAGWLVAPNITSSPSTWVGVIGPRYDGADWNLEVMGGAVISDGKATPLVDVRIELTPELFGLPLYSFVNPEWIDPGSANTGYLYAQLDYMLPHGIGLVGLETENVWKEGEDNLSLGPHIVLPLGQMVFVIAYQFTRGHDLLWLRGVLNF